MKEYSLDFCDTFEDIQHIRDSFANADVVVNEGVVTPPFTLSVTVTTLPESSTSTAATASIGGSASKKSTRGRKSTKAASTAHDNEIAPDARVPPRISRIVVSSSARACKSPYASLYASNVPKGVRYTPKQVEAITSGMQDKMTMIVGPPGTGKTDVAVQIIANLYHQYPTQKILVVTHSNAALNDIFAKIMTKEDISPHHLLRLGSGERDLRENIVARTMQQKAERLREQLEMENTFSKVGRVNWSLNRRLQLLAQVQHLAVSLGIAGDYGSSCEVAEYFFVSQVRPRIQQAEKSSVPMSVEIFPFRNFFGDLPSESWQQVDIFTSCLRTIEGVFEELRDFRAYELLRTQTLRGDYLLTKQVRCLCSFLFLFL